jgi:Zn-dependent protease with chaperone function
MAFAIFFDGYSARMHRVDLQAGDGALTVRGDDFARIYRSTEGELAEPFAGAPALLYLPDGARCEVACPRARAALAEALGYRKPRVVRWQERWRGALAALALLAALLAWTVLRGLPAAADRVAQALPVSVDISLGARALEQMRKQGIVGPTRLPSERVDEIRQVLRALLPDSPQVPVRLEVCVSDALGANALALPDGTIVVTDAMVRLILGKHQDFDAARSAQLAGVLAHELGHLERRHGMRALAGGSLATALSAALFGDFSTVAAGAPALLLHLRYSREMEAEADRDAIALLRAHHMSPAPLADLFEALDRTPQAMMRRRLPRWLTAGGDYTASHPGNAERAALLRAAAR